MVAILLVVVDPVDTVLRGKVVLPFGQNKPHFFLGRVRRCLGSWWLAKVLTGFSDLVSAFGNVDCVNHANQVLGLVLMAHASAADNLLQSSFRLFYSSLGRK